MKVIINVFQFTFYIFILKKTCDKRVCKELMKSTVHLAQQAIFALETQLARYSITPVIHFELEGAYCPALKVQHQHQSVNYGLINKQLKKLNIEGELKPEYWRNQWEYVSLFNGQTPLKEAHHLANAMQVLPKLFKLQGIEQVLIKPVIWSGDKARLLSGCKSIFSANQQAVHIPNAVQINISANNSLGENMAATGNFGETLQHCLLKTSYQCCLLFLPEPEAFERITLKQDFALTAELSSPSEISGGHQGSIALYKQWGKHNQAMGQTPLVCDRHQEPILYQNNWQSTARVEHRLGAASWHYCPFINVAFALANMLDAVELLPNNQHLQFDFSPVKLPQSLYQRGEQLGAVELFQQDTWFCARINSVVKTLKESTTVDTEHLDNDLGEQLKQAILKQYLHAPVASPLKQNVCEHASK